jgi:hypothetical protein
MQQMSIGRAWDEMREVLRRDGSLIATVGLALMVLPGVIADMVRPPVPAGQMAEPGWWSLFQFLALLIGVIGQLAVVQIALGSGRSVGQAISHGARRTPAFIGATMLWVLPMVLLFAPFIRRIQANPTSPDPTSMLVIFLLSLVLLFLAVRLLFTTPIASAEPVGPIAILRCSWEMTRGRWWRLCGFLILFFIAAVIIVTAVTSVVGVLVGLADGPPEPWSIGALIVALTSQILSALLTILLVVLLTRLYVQQASRPDELEAVVDVPKAP